jgi:hypothetical protein
MRERLKEAGVQVREEFEAMRRPVCVQRTGRQTEIASRGSSWVS